MTNRYWEKYPRLVELVRQDHIIQKAWGGHDIAHALMVAQYADIIAPDEPTGELAWVAGLLHNTDRIFPGIRGEKDATTKYSAIEETLEAYLCGVDLKHDDKRRVKEAVLNHHKPNDPADSPVTVTLKDADRLANIGVNNIIRSGQHYHNLPAYDPRYVTTPDPQATYREPRTVLHDVRCSLEWESWLRLPKAKELADRWFRLYERFVKAFADQLEETDLLPFPFGNDYDGIYE